MRSKDLKPIIEQLLPDFPSFRLKGHYFFRDPVGDILSGFCFESSGWERWGFYLWAFGQPMYVPKGRITLNRGRRIGERGGWWEVSAKDKVAVVPHISECMRSKGFSLLEKFDTPLKLARSSIHDFNGTVPQAEIIAYSFAHAGEREAAMEWLTQVEVSVESARDSTERITNNFMGKGQNRRKQVLVDEYRQKNNERCLESLNRAQQLRRALGDSPESARQLLAEWRRYTLDALGLTKYAAETDVLNRTGKPSQR